MFVLKRRHNGNDVSTHMIALMKTLEISVNRLCSDTSLRTRRYATSIRRRRYWRRKRHFSRT
ncbi:unnamed protein product [Clavelina lepadiformis]|uniref:Uncharacterized protein n=1 Tax=Clavelina lepadiformis TaxID=159417 RepID=A0ABP0F0J4_CLALP